MSLNRLLPFHQVSNAFPGIPLPPSTSGRMNEESRIRAFSLVPLGDMF